ncbi:MAG: hypothetical protein KA297_25890 [Kofleriaceae bacterium]|jgi:hypothetical protein|nr:hypothetical protein [Kofleriaceae bacterium]MBP6835751.1 hypothetical protein [Kofleriaceae bacterium]
MPRPPPPRLAAAAALLALVPACSWLTVQGPPPVPAPAPGWAGAPGGPPGLQAAPASPRTDVPCTRSKLAPGFDTGVAVVYGGMGALMALLGLSLQNDRDDYNRFMGGMFVVTGVSSIAFAAPWWMSSRAGYRKVDACRRLTGG